MNQQSYSVIDPQDGSPPSSLRNEKVESEVEVSAAPYIAIYCRCTNINKETARLKNDKTKVPAKPSMALDMHPQRLPHHHIRSKRGSLGRDALPINVQRSPCHVPPHLQRLILIPPDLDRDHIANPQRVILRSGIRTRSVENEESLLVVLLAVWRTAEEPRWYCAFG